MAKIFSISSTKVQSLNSKVQPEGIHAATRYTLLLCRWAGFFPVTGLMGPRESSVRFVWKSPYTLLLVFGVTGQLIMVIFLLQYIFALNHSDMRYMHRLCMYLSSLLSALVTVRLAFRWPNLLQTAKKLENDLPKFQFRNVTSACNSIVGVMFFCELLNQVLSVVFYARISADCFGDDPPAEAYFKYTNSWVFKNADFSIWKAIFFQIVMLQSAFLTNFTDSLIMVFSVHLAAYFQDFNDTLKLHKNKYPGMWQTFRKHYTRLTKLVRIVDAEIGFLVLISFTANLVFVCVQLFKVIRKDKAHNTTDCDVTKISETLESIERILYFGFSTLFITIRALLVGLLASRLHTASLSPTRALYEAPTSTYSAEAQRFLDQIKLSKIALTGLGFFHVTRETVLSVLASIVTYELMLLQFTGK